VLAMAILDRTTSPPVASRLMIAYYGANLAMPMGLAALSGMWLAVVFTAAAAILGLVLAQRAESSGRFPAVSRPLGGAASA